ncbi:MAG TPA: ABC transporter ATP-binding protein/permease [Candidatus Blautia merdavium]|uniref:ABC transporter ATP-binding protein/permease n=1 Tax=Candidatus Blautia merdavium TaxID=2838494 RepID=A0A9D2TBA4_9FIRM|nr:ABC transporter ATP-binding protein/permease [Candidatus Blautia merdavium]
MFRLLPYLKNYKKESIIGPLFKLLEVCFELIVPLITANIIDVGIRRGDLGYILARGGILVFMGVLGLTCSLTAQYFAAKASVGFGTEVRHDLFAHIQRLSYAEVDKIGSATLVTRMTSDINQAQSGVNLVLRLFLRSPFVVVGAVVMSFTISVRLSVIFLVAVPVLALIIYGIMVITIPLYRKVQKWVDQVLLSTRENLAGIRVVRAFCTQKKEQEEFEEKCSGLFGEQIHVGKISACMNPMTYVVVNAATIAIVWYGGFQVDAGAVTQGEIIALVNYMSQILLALVALANLIVSFTKAMASGDRIMEVFDLKPGIISGEGRKREDQTYAVEMENVQFSYTKDAVPALSDIHLKIRQGETVGIIGGTGSGKSTLVQLIGRFYDADRGRVKVFGTDVKDYDLQELRSKIGMVPQRAVLFHGTIRENLKVGKENASEKEMYEALKTAQALEVAESKEDGLDAMISEGGKNLSGGQRQRLTIARALVRKPQILILDDSASALDFATDARLRRALKEDTENMTVFLVSQRVSSLMHADRILVLEDGEPAGMGTHEELLKTCQVYREICRSQLSEKEVQANG